MVSLDPGRVAAALCGVPRGSGVPLPPLPAPADCRDGPRDVSGLRACLERVLATAPFAGSDVALSGGLDSAALAAFAVRLGQRPTAWTLDDGRDGESAPARLLARRLGLAHASIRVAVEELPDHFALAVRACDSALWNGRAVAKALFWARVAERGARAVLVGSGADELLGDPSPGYGALRAERARQHALGATLLRSGWRSRMPDVESWLGPDEADVRRALVRSIVPHETLPPEVAAGHSAGISVAMPYLQPAVAGMALALPASRRRHDGHDKWLLRAALEGMLPDAVRWKPKTPRVLPPGGGSESAGKRWLELLDTLLEPSALERLECVEPGAARALFERHAAGRPDAAGYAEREATLMRLASLVVLATPAG